jgi:hypothetical protein
VRLSPLEQAEALAEDVQTDLEQNAWPAAEARLRELQRVGDQLTGADANPPMRTAYRQAVDSLHATITRRSRYDALTAGNRVSRIVTGMMATHPTKVPIAVAYMDVAGRDVLYAVQQDRWKSAAGPVRELAVRYSEVQAGVKASNPALDQRVTEEIAQLQRAVSTRTRRGASSLAQALLENVDRIEQVY